MNDILFTKWLPLESVTFDKTLHRATFGPALEFGADANCLVFPASDLDRPNPGADPVLASRHPGLRPD